MSHKPVSSARTIGGWETVYVHDDRIEVGEISPVCTELLRRVAFRDVVRVVTWSAKRTWLLVMGVIVAVIGVVVAVGGLVSGDEGLQIAGAIMGSIVVLLAAPSLWMGRPGGITRFRVEGVHGDLEGFLAGSASKRAAVVADLIARIDR